MHLQVILGSIREGRRSGPVAQWAYGQAQAQIAKHSDLTVELIDLKAWKLPLFDLEQFPSEGNDQNPLQQRWAATIARADGYLFVSPEYNHGYTAALKNALDSLYAEWNRKPASFVAFGNAEGARDMTAKIRDGVFHADPREDQRFGVMFDEWLWWANALRAACAGA